MGKSLKPVRLLRHPGFSIPVPPVTDADANAFNAIVDWVLECVARFVSPSPKEDNENEEFKCEDLARAIREDLRKVLKVRERE